MIRRETLPRVLLLLAGFVFFSVNTVYLLGPEAREMYSPPAKSYQFDFEGIREGGPYLNLKSAMLVNYDNGEVLYAKNPDLERPIASITKLVTAMVVLDSEIDLKATAKITRDDARRSSRSRLAVGYELTLLDLLHAALLSSDNRAARALARTVSGSREEFVREMNRKLRKLGLKNTVCHDPTGLDPRNTSTAHEVSKILHYAYDYELIRRITSMRMHRVKIQNRRGGKYLTMVNTNRFVISPYDVLAGKTGYICAADYCLTTLVMNDNGRRLSLVVLGVPGDKLRFREARRLVDWGFKQIS